MNLIIRLLAYFAPACQQADAKYEVNLLEYIFVILVNNLDIFIPNPVQQSQQRGAGEINFRLLVTTKKLKPWVVMMAAELTVVTFALLTQSLTQTQQADKNKLSQGTLTAMESLPLTFKNCTHKSFQINQIIFHLIFFLVRWKLTLVAVSYRNNVRLVGSQGK